MTECVFISDLHLTPTRPEIIDLFVCFADEIASEADTLYILGDFMEYWLGDDDTESGLDAALSSITKLQNSGTEVFFMHGNRDFLVGEKLADTCHFSLIDDPVTIKLDSQPVLLMHGDTLCTDDVEYHKFRKTVRHTDWINNLLDKPIEERRQLAKTMRQQSTEAASNKAEDIMDVNQQAVLDTMHDQGVQFLIHGHTHRPAIHDLTINGQPAKRIVLGDWHSQGSFLKISSLNNIELSRYR